MGNINDFEWGETPALFVAQAHHFLVCPAWFDEECDKEISMYDIVDLPHDYRTDRAKKYQAFEARPNDRDWETMCLCYK